MEQRAEAGREAVGECNNIRCHIDTLLDKDFLAHIGAGSAEELHMRVFRIIQELNKIKGDDVDPHEKNYEPCGNCGHMTLPTRARKCSNCHGAITTPCEACDGIGTLLMQASVAECHHCKGTGRAATQVIPPPQILC